LVCIFIYKTLVLYCHKFHCLCFNMWKCIWYLKNSTKFSHYFKFLLLFNKIKIYLNYYAKFWKRLLFIWVSIDHNISKNMMTFHNWKVFDNTKIKLNELFLVKFPLWIFYFLTMFLNSKINCIIEVWWNIEYWPICMIQKRSPI